LVVLQFAFVAIVVFRLICAPVIDTSCCLSAAVICVHTSLVFSDCPLLFLSPRLVDVISLHKGGPLQPQECRHALCGTCGQGWVAPLIQPESLLAVWRPATAGSTRYK
jgi:hypothetical protein